MGDPATWYLALGVLLLVTLRRPAWRRPVLALALVQYAPHAANHLLVYAEAIGARRPLRVPVWLARLAAGPTAVLLVRQPGAANAKARRELDWQPRWRRWREGFREAPR